MERTSRQPFAGCQVAVWGPARSKVDSIPNLWKFLERTESPSSHAAIRLLCPQILEHQPDDHAKQKLAVFQSFALIRPLQVPAAFQGFQHGDLIRIFQVGAYRDAHTDAGNTDAQRLEELGEIDGGGFAFGCRVRGDNDLLDRAAL